MERGWNAWDWIGWHRNYRVSWNFNSHTEYLDPQFSWQPRREYALRCGENVPL